MAGHEHVNSLGHWAGKAGTEARKSTFRRKTFHFLEKLNNVVFLMSGAWERCRDGLVSPHCPQPPSRMPWVPVHTVSSGLSGSAVWGHIQMQREAVTPHQTDSYPRAVSEDARLQALLRRN